MSGFPPMTPSASETSVFPVASTGFRPRFVPAILCACATLVLYLLLPAVLEQITSAQPSRVGEVFAWVQPVTREWLNARQDQSDDLRTAVHFSACFGGLFAAWFFMLRLARRDPSPRMQRFVFWSGAVFLAVNLLSPVMLSTDIHAYAFYGRLISIYHLDAYAAMAPDSVAADHFLALTGRGYSGSFYGPLWTLISVCLDRLGGEGPGLVAFLFRAVSAAAILSGAGLIGGILRRISPARAAQGMVFFLWNPLVIVESAMSGHNDAVMAALLLLGIWLHVKGRKTGAVTALLLSALVKFVTGPLVLLYLWMVLRQPASWRERAWFLARSLLCMGAVAWALFFMAHVKSDLPATRFAGSPAFYTNNFHELIFKGIRRLLGEDAASVQVPVEFKSWWFTTVQSGELRAAPEETAEVLGPVAKNRRLLVIAPYVADWATVFDPVLRRKGFVSDDLMEEIDNDSGGLDDDPAIAQLEEPPPMWPTVIKANLWIRRGCWLLFALFGLLAAWRTTDFDRFLSWSGAVMLAIYFLIATQLWPWYLIWALTLGALKPANLPAKLAMFISVGVLTLYLTIGYEVGDLDWIYNLRSIPAILLPTAVFMVMSFAGRKNGRTLHQPG
jgi:hypothetical protein